MQAGGVFGRRCVRRFVGGSGRALRNEAGDFVAQSRDEMREICFDFNDTAPHEIPHVHVIEYRRVNHTELPDSNRRIWPSDASEY
jgi:hypothetical protein